MTKRIIDFEKIEKQFSPQQVEIWEKILMATEKWLCCIYGFLTMFPFLGKLSKMIMEEKCTVLLRKRFLLNSWRITNE